MRQGFLKKTIGALLMAGIFCGCSALAASASEKKYTQTINVGCDTYAPFSYLDADGQPTGIDVELATEAFHRMGYEPNFVFINWNEKKDLVESDMYPVFWTPAQK